MYSGFDKYIKEVDRERECLPGKTIAVTKKMGRSHDLFFHWSTKMVDNTPINCHSRNWNE